MKKFSRFRTLSELRKVVRGKGWKLDTKHYDLGNDSVGFNFTIGRVAGLCIVNMFNGRFCGSLDARPVFFSSSKTEHQDAPWFRALLNIVYVPKPKRKAGEQQCHKCGCTDSDCSGCIQRTGKACFWVDEKTCSACANPKQLSALKAETDRAVKKALKSFERTSKPKRAA